MSLNKFVNENYPNHPVVAPAHFRKHMLFIKNICDSAAVANSVKRSKGSKPLVRVEWYVVGRHHAAFDYLAHRIIPGQLAPCLQVLDSGGFCLAVDAADKAIFTRIETSSSDYPGYKTEGIK